MTRFGEFLKIFGTFKKHHLVFLRNFQPTLPNLFCYCSISISVSDKVLKNHLAIWSHCSMCTHPFLSLLEVILKMPLSIRRKMLFPEMPLTRLIGFIIIIVARALIEDSLSFSLIESLSPSLELVTSFLYLHLSIHLFLLTLYFYLFVCLFYLSIFFYR